MPKFSGVLLVNGAKKRKRKGGVSKSLSKEKFKRLKFIAATSTLPYIHITRCFSIF